MEQLVFEYVVGSELFQCIQELHHVVGNDSISAGILFLDVYACLCTGRFSEQRKYHIDSRCRVWSLGELANSDAKNTRRRNFMYGNVYGNMYCNDFGNE